MNSADTTTRPAESPVATWWDLSWGERAATVFAWFACGLTAGAILVSLVASVKIHALQSEIENRKSAIEHRQVSLSLAKTRRVSLHPAEKVRPEQPADQLAIANRQLPIEKGRGGILPPCPPRPGQLPIVNWQLAIEKWVVGGLWAVETNSGTNIRPGDGGAARGHLQQHKGHWGRGCEYLGVNWHWPEDTHDFAKARAVAIANWRRDAWPEIRWIVAEELARRFRLPNDPYRAGNDAYWEKVKEALATENAEVQR